MEGSSVINDGDVFWETVANGPETGPPMEMKDFRRWARIASQRLAEKQAIIDVLIQERDEWQYWLEVTRGLNHD